MEVENYKNVFQIFISNSNETALSELLESKIQKVKDTYQDYTHKIYNNEMCRDFLFEFDKETLISYDTLKPYAYKADLTRLCLLHEYGGWYFDISLYPEFKLEFESAKERYSEPTAEEETVSITLPIIRLDKLEYLPNEKLGNEELMDSNRLELPFGMHLDHIPHHR